MILTEMGHRCGYVKLPEGHLCRDMDYDDIPIEVHGGLTYGPSENGWVGFDCGHCYDTPEIWTLEKTIEETKKMADQVYDITIAQCIRKKLEYMPDWFTRNVIFKEFKA